MAKDKLTITLTGRAPVTIETKLWPVIASAATNEDAARGKAPEEAAWKQWLTVRQHADGRAIVYGVHERPFDSRRAGELLVIGSVNNGVELGDIPDAIYRVAAYLKFDRDLADKCIANLPAVDVNDTLTDSLEIQQAIDLAVQYGGIDGAHHKAWVIDQMVRVLAGPRYADIVQEAKSGEDGPDTYDWEEGIAP